MATAARRREGGSGQAAREGGSGQAAREQDRQREALRLARSLRDIAGDSVGLVGVGRAKGMTHAAAVRAVALRAAEGLAALGAPVAVVSVLAGEPSEQGGVALVSAARGVVELMVQAAPGHQLADEIRYFRDRLQREYQPLLWDLGAVDCLGVDAPVLHVVGEVVLVGWSGRVHERTLTRFQQAAPPGHLRGIILIG
jgi:hypothetical protein